MSLSVFFCWPFRWTNWFGCCGNIPTRNNRGHGLGCRPCVVASDGPGLLCWHHYRGSGAAIVSGYYREKKYRFSTIKQLINVIFSKQLRKALSNPLEKVTKNNKKKRIRRLTCYPLNKNYSKGNNCD